MGDFHITKLKPL